MGASGLGSLLVKEGFLTEQDRLTITKTCGQDSWAFAKSIVSMGLLDEDELAAFFAERTRYSVAPKNFLHQFDPQKVQAFDRRMFARLEALPLDVDEQRITVAVADPLDKSTLKQLEFFTGLEVVPIIAPLSQIYEGLTRLNPEFQPRPTAISHFLRNHAAASWVKQKLNEQTFEEDLLDPQEKAGARARAPIDYDDDDDISEVGDDDSLDDLDAPNLEQETDGSAFDTLGMENDDELDMNAADLNSMDPDEASGSLFDSDVDMEDDPFATAKTAAVADNDLWPEADDASLGPDDDLGDDFVTDAKPKARAAAPAPKAEDDELSGLGALDDDEFAMEEASPAAASKADDDFFSDADFASKPAGEPQAEENLEIEGDEAETSLEADSGEELSLEDELESSSTDERGLDMEASSEDELGLDLEASSEDERGFDIEASSEDELGLDIEASSEDELGLDMEASSEDERGLDMETSSEDELGLDMETSSEDELGLDGDTQSLETGIEDEFTLDDEVEDETSLSLTAETAEENPISGHFESDDLIEGLEAEPLSADEQDQSIHILTASLKTESKVETRSPPPAPAPTRRPPTYDDIDIMALSSEPDAGSLEPIRVTNLDDASALSLLAPPMNARDKAQPPAPAAIQSLASEPAALLNEVLLRISMCFDKDSVGSIMRDAAPQLAPEGCLIFLETQPRLAIYWLEHELQTAALPKAWLAFLRKLVPQLAPGTWMRLQTPGDWPGEAQELAVFRGNAQSPPCLWLGQHSIEDTGFTEGLESLIDQLERKLGAG